LWDAMLEGDVPPDELIDLAARALETETDELNVQRIVGFVTRAYWRYLPAAERDRRGAGLEAPFRRRLGEAETTSRKALHFRAYPSVARTPDGLERLTGIWRGRLRVPGLELAERDLTELAQELAVREVDGWREILDTQRERIRNPDRRAR